MGARPYQQECIDLIDSLDSGAYLVQMGTGLGKCLAKGTGVLMYDGSVKAVEDVQVGDLLMGPDSQPRTVTSLAHGTEQMYRITPCRGGDPYTVNASHILSLKMAGKPGCGHFAPDGRKYCTGDICNISVLQYINASDSFKSDARGWHAGVEFPHKEQPIPPYILGLWLGDGTSEGTCITTMEPEVVIELHEYCRSNGMRLSVLGNRCAKRALSYNIVAQMNGKGKNKFRNFLKEYELWGNKHIPKEYLYADRQQRLELLAGIVDSDGYLDHNTGYQVTTHKESLRDDYLYLARSLGFCATCGMDRGNYRIFISGDVAKIPVRVRRRMQKKRVSRTRLKDPTLTSIKVEPVGVGEYFGFTIDGPDHLFLLKDFTVTHNTYTFTHLKRKGRVLVLAHREELVHQPAPYYDCPVGFEMASEHSNGEEVVIASVQSLIHRLDQFKPDAFDMIITDECHHAVAPSYRKIYDYFKPRLHIGFTATANRGDKVRLDTVFDKIIFERNLKWGIENGYLCNIRCLRADIGYDLSRVKKRMGDYEQKALAAKVDQEKANECVARAYREKAVGQTLIFASSVQHAHNISKKIPGSVVVSAATENRSEIIKAFTERKIKCLINCMIFTEGTDLPLIETIMIARPTQNESLYCLDANTEVLTANGWKKDVGLGEMVAAFDLETGRIQYAPALAKVRRKLRPDERFISINTPDTDIRVTDQHRMVCRTDSTHCWGIKTAAEAASTAKVYLPVAGHTDEPGISLTSNEIRQLGMAVAGTPLLHRLSEQQFDLMLESSQTAGLGTSQAYAINGSLEFVSNLQVAALMRGWSANIMSVLNVQGIYTLHLRKQAQVHINAEQWTIEDHTDESCWCVQNRYGTLVTRRNGKVTIMGNCQMVGRGTRLYEGKPYLTLIDCVGVTGRNRLCTAPTLLGLDADQLPEREKGKVSDCMLTDVPEIMDEISTTPDAWILNLEEIDVFAEQNNVDTKAINWFYGYDGSLRCSLPDGGLVKVGPMNELGRTSAYYRSPIAKNDTGLVLAEDVPIQEALDKAAQFLNDTQGDSRGLWDMKRVSHWGTEPATIKQIAYIHSLCGEPWVPQEFVKYIGGLKAQNKLTKRNASVILDRLLEIKSGAKRLTP